jgi:hypothetical protein
MNRPLALAAPAVFAMPAVAAFWFVGIGGGGDSDKPPAVLLPPHPVIDEAQAAPPPPAAPVAVFDPVVDCGPVVDGAFLEETQIVSYYGNPYVPAMGILGELQPEQLVAKVKAHARKYDALNGARDVQPALHMVYASAQPKPGEDGRHLLYVDRRTVERYIDLACEHDMLVFLDIQVGLSEAESEVKDILEYLEQPHVHAALDPEFAMQPGQIPGRSVGTLDASDINAAQGVLQSFVEERGLPDKMLVVHQFTDGMVTRRHLLKDYPNVRLVFDMDGIGTSEIKQAQFATYAGQAEYSGIKLFFKQDPGLMREEDVIRLGADVVIYH